MEIIFSLEEINDAAALFLRSVADQHIFTFSGELGAGKTTFISALCRQLNVKDTISSPTFSIIQQYETTDGKTIYHMDLYRIRNEEEAINAGVEDCLQSDAICMVEWPEKAPGIFTEKTIHCELSIENDYKRKLIFRQQAGR